MNESLKDKIAKIYALVNQGATEGERAAAKKALDRLLSKYQLAGENLELIAKKVYVFKYKTELDVMLMSRLIAFFMPNECGTRSPWAKVLKITLFYEDWVTLDCTYAYFRKHMAGQWKTHCLPVVNRCRTAKTRNKKRAELYPAFFTEYAIRSGIVNQAEIKYRPLTSAKDIERSQLIKGIQGGDYKKQVITDKLLEQ